MGRFTDKIEENGKMKFSFGDLEVITEDKTIAKADVDDIEYDNSQTFDLMLISKVVDIMVNEWGTDSNVKVLLDYNEDIDVPLGFLNTETEEVILLAPMVYE